MASTPDCDSGGLGSNPVSPSKPVPTQWYIVGDGTWRLATSQEEIDANAEHVVFMVPVS